MTQDIKITARIEPATPGMCIFELESAIHPGVAKFRTPVEAEQSPLAQKIFALPDVSSVRIARNQIAVTKVGTEDWSAMARQIGAVIRSHLASGATAVPADYQSHLSPDELIRVRVEEIFEADINPSVAAHGGHITLIDVKDGDIYVKMGGGCQGCSKVDVTLKKGIEAIIREKLPAAGRILDVTDHAGGTNPYYAEASATPSAS